MLGIELKDYKLESQEWNELDFAKSIVTIENRVKVTIASADTTIEYMNYFIEDIQYWLYDIKQYRIAETGDILLPSDVFWKLYKGAGKTFLKQKFILNGVERKFAEPASYFSEESSTLYGVYDNDKMIFVGYSGNKLSTWKKMYCWFVDDMHWGIADPDKIEFRELKTGLSTNENKAICNWCIKHFSLNRRFNREQAIKGSVDDNKIEEICQEIFNA